MTSLFQSPYMQPSYRGESFGSQFIPAATLLLMSQDKNNNGAFQQMPYYPDQDPDLNQGNKQSTASTTSNQGDSFEGEDKSGMSTNDVARLIAEKEKRFYDLQRYLNSPETLAKQLAAVEPFEERRAQRQQQLGLQSNVAGFLLKGLPDMLLKAYASRAAYYPEMISGATRGLAEGFRAGAEAAKPRFDYYQGLTS